MVNRLAAHEIPDSPHAQRHVGFNRRCLDLASPGTDADCFFGNLFQQISFFAHQIGQVTLLCVQDLCDPPDLMDPLRNNVAVFIEASPEGVDQFGALVDEPF